MNALRERSAGLALWLLAPLAVLSATLGLLPVPTVLLLLVLVGGLLALCALARPVPALLVATAIAVLIPFYAGRYVVGSVGLSPLAACCLVLLPAAFAARAGVRLARIDVAVGALVVLRCASALVNAEGPLGASLNVLLTTALPYAVFRFLALGRDMPRRMAEVVVACAVPLAAIGLYERAGNRNPFFTLLPVELEAAQWARPELRASGVRAEASFGHPIAFGMFLAMALLLAVVLAVTVDGMLLRAALLGACGVILLGLTATLSRGPLLAAGLGVGVWLLLHVLRVDALRVGVAAAVIAVLAVTTPVLGTLESLQRSSTGDTAEARSAEYRLQVLEVASDRDQFSLLGLPASGGPVSEAVARRTGLKSIDSELAVVHLTSGGLALAAFAAVGLLLLGGAVRPGLALIDAAWGVALGAAFLTLTTVALLTQFEELFWAFTAVVAGIVQRHRTEVS